MHTSPGSRAGRKKVSSSGSSGVPTSRTITAGAGLTGGGDLSADRTFDVGAGTGITINANDVALTIPVVVSSGGTGATTLTGLLQGNGTSAVTAITNSSTVGQILRVTGASTYAWGALDLADTDAITNDLPYANLTPSGAASKLLGRGSASGAGDWQEITLGTGLSMSTTTINASNAFTGSGTTNYYTRWSTSTALTVGLAYDNGSDFSVITPNDSPVNGSSFSLKSGATTPNIFLEAGDVTSSSANAGGNITIACGVGGGEGGTLTLTGGDSGTTPAAGGSILMTGGNSWGVVGGEISLISGSNLSEGPGGNITLTCGGGGPDAGDGGSVTITAGSSGASSTYVGGSVSIAAGQGGGISGDGGSITLTAGVPIAGIGGAITLQAGNGVGSLGGNVDIIAGTSDINVGGSITLTAGDAITSGTDGGDILLTAGDRLGGNRGRYMFTTVGDPTSHGIFNFQALGSDRTYTMPDADLDFSSAPSGSFISADAKTITVYCGIIVSIV